MTNRLGILCVLACLLAWMGLATAGCSSVRTSYDFAPRTDFASWRTYAWYPTEGIASGDLRFDNTLFRRRIEAAVDRDLGSRGFVRLEDEDASPDFYVNFHLSTDQRLDVRTLNRGYRPGPWQRGWGRSGWDGVGWTETRITEIAEGTLAIDFVDASAGQLAWRGTGTRRLTRDPSPDRITRQVDEAVREILAQFPPQ